MAVTGADRPDGTRPGYAPTRLPLRMLRRRRDGASGARCSWLRLSGSGSSVSPRACLTCSPTRGRGAECVCCVWPRWRRLGRSRRLSTARTAAAAPDRGQVGLLIPFVLPWVLGMAVFLGRRIQLSRKITHQAVSAAAVNHAWSPRLTPDNARFEWSFGPPTPPAGSRRERWRRLSKRSTWGMCHRKRRASSAFARRRSASLRRRSPGGIPQRAGHRAAVLHVPFKRGQGAVVARVAISSSSSANVCASGISTNDTSSAPLSSGSIVTG